MTKLITLLMFLSFAITTNAESDKTGNGGKGVVCPDSIELLDYVRARDIWKMQMDFVKQGDAFDRAKEIVKRIEEFEPARTARYLDAIDNFETNTLMSEDTTLFMLEDTNDFGIPRGCKLELIINQQGPKYEEDKRYLVNKKLWDLMDENQKAGLIVHEVVLPDIIDSNNSNGDFVLYFTSKLTEGLFNSYPQYIKILQESRIDEFVHENSNLLLNSQDTYFYKNGKIKRTRPATSRNQNGDINQIIKFHPSITNYNLPLDEINAINFYKTGEVEAIEFHTLIPSITIKQSVTSHNLTPNLVVCNSTKFIRFISFHENGRLKSAHLAEFKRKNRKFIMENGRSKTIKTNSYMEFTDDGLAKDKFSKYCTRYSSYMENTAITNSHFFTGYNHVNVTKSEKQTKLVADWVNSLRWNMPISQDQSGSEFEQVRQIISKIETLDKKRYERYLTILNKLEKDFAQSIVNNYNFLVKNELNVKALPEDSQVEPVITFGDTLFTNETYFKINGDIWNEPSFTTEQKASAILETLVLEEMKSIGVAINDNVYYMTSILKSEGLNNMTPSEYRDRLLQTGFLYKSAGLYCQLYDRHLSISNRLIECLPFGENTIKLGEDNKVFNIDPEYMVGITYNKICGFMVKKTDFPQTVKIQGIDITIDTERQITLYDNGKIREMGITEGPYKLRKANSTHNPTNLPIIRYKKYSELLVLHENGRVNAYLSY